MARGKLRIYLGAAPGVGKTYAMLNEGWRRRSRGTDVVVGYVETHGRATTAAQIRDLDIVAPRQLEYRGSVFDEMDVDAILARNPQVVLIDELAHSNIPGSRHEKRWEDINELLDFGIDVVSTLNIQHLASLTDVVERIAGVTQRETVPDSVVRAADLIELVDMHPEALRRRMAHGNIYPLDRVDEELAAYRQRYGISEPWETKERIVVALTGAPGGEHLTRRAARMAARVNGELVGVHVRTTDGYASNPVEELDAQRRLLAELGGRYAEVTGSDAAEALVHFARAENATQLVLGASSLSRWAELTRGSVINRVIRSAGGVDVHVISPVGPAAAVLPPAPRRRRPVPFPSRRRVIGWGLAATVPLLAAGLSPLRASLSLSGALLCLLLGVMAVATIGGVGPAVAATVAGTLAADFFFVVPYHSLRIDRGVDVVAIAAFFTTAGVVSVLVDRLARRGLQVLRGRAEAEALARLAGDAVSSSGDALRGLVAELRRTFDLDAVAILQAAPGGWAPVASAGDPVPARPEEAQFSAELVEGTVLVLAGSALGADDIRLLNAFVAQLRLAQERAALETRAASATELEEANSLRNALLSAVSHDLRTPLAGIKAAATSLLSREVTWDPPQVETLAKTIDGEADRLAKLVSNLLDMGRLQAGALRVNVRAASLEDLLYDAVDSLGEAEAGVTIDVAGDLPSVSADPGLLERALANVVDNALAWSPPGTPVRLEAAVLDDHVHVRVVDQGPGIPAGRREDVFQPFQRLGDRAGGRPDGVGLGLAVARGFVAAIGGEIGIEDTPGGGATVVIRLRRAAP